MRIDNKKQNRIRTHRFTWKTLIGKITGRGEEDLSCQKLLQEGKNVSRYCIDVNI